MARSKVWRLIRKQYRAYRRARKAPDPGWQRAKPRTQKPTLATMSNGRGKKQAPTLREEMARIKAENKPVVHVPRETPVRVTSTGDYWNTDQTVVYQDGKVVRVEQNTEPDWNTGPTSLAELQEQDRRAGRAPRLWSTPAEYRALSPEQKSDSARRAGLCGYRRTTTGHACMHSVAPGSTHCAAGHPVSR